MAAVPVNGGLDDSGVGGVDVILVQRYGVEKGILGLCRTSAEGCGVYLADGHQGTVRAGVDVRFYTGELPGYSRLFA